MSSTENDLYYYRARYYDPGVGRFLSEDPLRPDDGVTFYIYVGNNPANFTDPSGLYGTAPDVPTPLPPRLDKFMKCMDDCTHKQQYVTATTNNVHVDPGHAGGTSVDIRPVGTPSKGTNGVYCCAGRCGAVWLLDERELKTKHGSRFHYHIQLELTLTPGTNSIPDRPECKPPGCNANNGAKK